MARKSSKAKPLGKTLKVKKSNGKTSTYTKMACGNKASMSKRADGYRKQGSTARVVQDPVSKKYCVFKGPKAKARGKK